MKIFWNTISSQMHEILDIFGGSDIGAKFYLAGGTALALQLGHRHSIDLDYFSQTEDIPSIREALHHALQSFAPILADSSWGNLVFLVNEVRVGFYGYGYGMVEPLISMENTRLASIADIGLMKLDALLARASRKDYHDIYVICQQLSLTDLLDLAPGKFPHIRDFQTQVVKRLAYFERADQEQPPTLVQDVPWNTVKAFFQQQALELGKSWLQ
jgi:hypothetical protein